MGRDFLTDENMKAKEKPSTARSSSRVFHGAPNRIRTCGLLIRSQTLYPAELWVLFIFSVPIALGTKSIIPRTAKNVNTFFQIFQKLFEAPFWGRRSGECSMTFGGIGICRKSKSKNASFSCKSRKNGAKIREKQARQSGRRQEKTPNVTSDLTVDKTSYPQKRRKKARLPVDKCG